MTGTWPRQALLDRRAQGLTLKTILKIAEATKAHLIVDFRRTGS
jgi:hypothetical protein